jgi:hypothetical protein
MTPRSPTCARRCCRWRRTNEPAALQAAGPGIGVRAQPLSCADRPAPNSCRSQIQGASSLLPAAPWLSASPAPCTIIWCRQSRRGDQAQEAEKQHRRAPDPARFEQPHVDLPCNAAMTSIERDTSERGTREPYLCAQSTAADLSLPMRNTRRQNVICPASLPPIRLACCISITFGIASREHAGDNVSSRNRTRRNR